MLFFYFFLKSRGQIHASSTNQISNGQIVFKSLMVFELLTPTLTLVSTGPLEGGGGVVVVLILLSG